MSDAPSSFVSDVSDVVLIGSGIMSANLGAMLKRLDLNGGEQEAAIQALWQYNVNWLTNNTSFFAASKTGFQVGFLLVAQIAGVQAVVNFNDFLLGRNVNGNVADYTGRFTLLDYFQAGQLASDFGASVQIA